MVRMAAVPEISVQTIDGIHLLVRKREIKDLCIRLDAFMMDGLGNGYDVQLANPA